jgi:TOBE domain
MNLLPTQQNGSGAKVGDYQLALPNNLTGDLKIAIRPEDLAIVLQPRPNAFAGVLDQIIDLGHYRKGLVKVPSVGTLKVYLPKVQSFTEGEPIYLLPARYLVYRDGRDPIEVRQPIDEAAIKFEA